MAERRPNRDEAKVFEVLDRTLFDMGRRLKPLSGAKEHKLADGARWTARRINN